MESSDLSEIYCMKCENREEKIKAVTSVTAFCMGWIIGFEPTAFRATT